jgi:hypothetical protein
MEQVDRPSAPGCLLSITWVGLSPTDRASFCWRLRRGGPRADVEFVMRPGTGSRSRSPVPSKRRRLCCRVAAGLFDPLEVFRRPNPNPTKSRAEAHTELGEFVFHPRRHNWMHSSRDQGGPLRKINPGRRAMRRRMLRCTGDFSNGSLSDQIGGCGVAHRLVRSSYMS